MNTDFSHVVFISAGAGSGKTYRLTQEVERAVTLDGIAPSRIIATTFTVKAAGELQDRVRQKLLESDHIELSEQVGQALIGTVHAVCEKLLKRFAFELGMSPVLSVLSLEDGARLFNHALDETMPEEDVRVLNALAEKLSQDGWRRDMKSVADRARENDLSLEAMLDFAQRNAEDFVGYCPPPDEAVSNAWMVSVLDRALQELDSVDDPTGGARDYRAHVEACRAKLAIDGCPWSVWMSLAAGGKAKSTKKSEPIAQTVRTAALRYAAHPQFQADVSQYIQRIVSVAAQAADRFRQLKLARGLIDFADMEREMLKALAHPVVVERLRNEVDLLLVDEFQDTNPLQLAIFIQLAQLAERVIFVGDVKQAIYAFRGCDPDLVFATLQSMTAERANTDKLPYSWRASSPLVEFINDLFTRAFAGEIPADEVPLEPRRLDETGEPAVRHWVMAGKNHGERYDALAAGIRKLHAQGTSVVDPQSGLCRPVCWGDFAVLARTNDHVEHIARTLKLRGVPVKLSLAGLLETPEIVLARACLRRLNDPTDTIASAEVLALAEAQAPERWLTDRMQHLQGEEDPTTWGEVSSPLLHRLARLREDSVYRSVVEIVARALNDVGARAVVTRWGPDALKVEQRQRNLDAFLELAVQYESHCQAQHRSATLTGFLFWLEKPSSPELDLQPVVTSGDAVHVLTYHRAKGLEWPVVVASDLNDGERSNLWGVRMLSGNFDLKNPLANRFLRYWPNVFGLRTSQPLCAHFEDSEEGDDSRRASNSERRRLAYVGLTRARDVLIFALPEQRLSKDAWLYAVCENGADFGVEVERLGAEVSAEPTNNYAPNWYLPREDVLHGAAIVSPSSMPADDRFEVVATHELGARLAISSVDMNALGLALHAVIGAEFINPGLSDASEILRAYGVEGDVRAEDAVVAAQRLRSFVRGRWNDGVVRVEYPIRLSLEGGQLARGFVDLLVELPDEVVIIDHKSFPRPRAEWPQLAKQYGAQLELYARAFAESGKAVRTFLHLPIGGAVLEIEPSAAIHPSQGVFEF